MNKNQLDGKSVKQKLWKKTSFRVAIVVLAAVAAAAVCVCVRHQRKNTNAGASRVQSVSAERGSISNTVEGSGNLEAAEITEITMPENVTADEISVESGDMVEKGQVLAKLNKASVIGALLDVQGDLDAVGEELEEDDLTELEEEKLEAEKSELKKAEKKLKALYKNPVLTADSAGVVNSVDISTGSQSAGSTQSEAKEMAASGSGMNASAMVYHDSSLYQNGMGEASLEPGYTAITLSAVSPVSNASEQGQETKEPTVITDFTEFSVARPKTGESPQRTIAETAMYTGTITWDCSDVFQAGTAYTAIIVLQAKDGYTFTEEHLPQIAGAAYRGSVSPSAAGSRLTIEAQFEKTEEISDKQTSNDDQEKNAQQETAKETEKSSAASSAAGNTNGSGKSTVSGAGLNTSGLTSSGSASAGNAAAGNTADSDGYGSGWTTAFTIGTCEQVKVSVSIDELDILSVKEGQTTQITLDALEGEEYEGVVTKVVSSADGGNGSTKYEAEITVPMDENMRIGMSATASIQVSEASDVLILPLTALQQRGQETFVYTGQDADGSLTGETVVETGLSDGQNVEITDGISEGTTVYYTRTVTTQEQTEGTGGMFPGAGGMDMMPGGRNGGQDRGDFHEKGERPGAAGGDGTAPQAPSGN